MQFNVNKNANLPFHLLSWGQHFVRKHNCEFLSKGNHSHTLHSHINRQPPIPIPIPISISAVRQSKSGSESKLRDAREKLDQMKDYMIDQLGINSDLMRICEKKGIATPKGTPVNVTYYRASDAYLQQTGKLETIIKEIKYTVDENTKITKNEKSNIGMKFKNIPIKYIYYTESDQIVRYGSPLTMEMLVSATNESTLLSGRRRNKDIQSTATEYMAGKKRRVYLLWCGVLWCAVVCCAVLWCAVVCCGVLWCAVLWCAVLCSAVLCSGVLCCGVLWCGVVCCGVV